MLEKQSAQGISGPMMKEVNGQFRILHDEEQCLSYRSSYC